MLSLLYPVNVVMSSTTAFRAIFAFLPSASSISLIFPLAFRFLSTYQVQEIVVNQIALKSYISTLLMLSLMMGILFEIPIVAYFLAKLGLIDRQLLTDYRKHAFIVLCILAAIITPTADIFTLMLVTVPLYFLYEISIYIVGLTNKNKTDD